MSLTVNSLGASSVAVSRFGLGTAALGGLFRSVTDEAAQSLVDAAFAAGISYFDTAPQYGHGVAEQRLGAALQGRARDSYVLSTKVGRLVVPDPSYKSDAFVDAPPSRVEFFFDPDSIKRSLDESLTRLGLDRVDIVYIHDPDDFLDQAIDEAYPVLHQMRDEGIIDAIGVGMNVSDLPTRFVKQTDIDVVLLAGRYTLLDQSSLDDLIPAVRERGVSMVVGGVLNSGILANPDADDLRYDYVPAPAEIIDRAKRIRDIAASHGVSLVHAAVAFVLREASVSAVLVGARNPQELHDSLSTDLDAIPAALWSDLHAANLIREIW